MRLDKDLVTFLNRILGFRPSIIFYNPSTTIAGSLIEGYNATKTDISQVSFSKNDYIFNVDDVKTKLLRDNNFPFFSTKLNFHTISIINVISNKRRDQSKIIVEIAFKEDDKLILGFINEFNLDTLGSFMTNLKVGKIKF